MAATATVLAVVLGHNRSRERTQQVVLSLEEAAEHLAAAGAVRCPLPHLLGLPLVMVPFGGDVREPNKAATYLLAAPATGTPPHSVGGTALVLRTDLRDFPLPEYQRWWEFLSGTLLPLYVIRSDDRDSAAVLDRCAPACLRFVAGLEEAVSNPNPNPKPSAASSFMIKAAAGGPCTPRSVLPSRPSFSRPDSQPCPPCSPDTPRSGLPHHGPAAAAAAAAWAGGSLDSRNSFPGDAPKTSGDSGERGPLEAAVSADAAWFRQRLAANCMV